MSEENTSSEGATQGSEGSTENQNSGNSNSISTEAKAEAVTTEDVSGLKAKRDELLGANKKLKDKLAALEEAEKERTETSLKEQEKWKEYAALKEKEAEDLKSKYESQRDRILDSKKMAAFLEHAPVKKKFWDNVDLTKIVTNPETGEIDRVSVQNYAESFSKEFSETLETTAGPKLPQNATAGGTAGLTLEEYRKLSAKEMRERAPEVAELLSKQYN